MASRKSPSRKSPSRKSRSKESSDTFTFEGSIHNNFNKLQERLRVLYEEEMSARNEVDQNLEDLMQALDILPAQLKADVLAQYAGYKSGDISRHPKNSSKGHYR